MGAFGDVLPFEITMLLCILQSNVVSFVLQFRKTADPLMRLI